MTKSFLHTSLLSSSYSILEGLDKPLCLTIWSCCQSSADLIAFTKLLVGLTINRGLLSDTVSDGKSVLNISMVCSAVILLFFTSGHLLVFPMYILELSLVPWNSVDIEYIGLHDLLSCSCKLERITTLCMTTHKYNYHEWSKYG